MDKIDLNSLKQLASKPPITGVKASTPINGVDINNLPQNGSKKMNAADMFIPAETPEGMAKQVQEMDSKMSYLQGNVTQYQDEIVTAKKNALRNLFMQLQDDFDVDLSNPDAIADFINTMKMEDPDFASYIEYVFNFLENFTETDVSDLANNYNVTQDEIQGVEESQQGEPSTNGMEVPNETMPSESMIVPNMGATMDQGAQNAPAPESPSIPGIGI